MEKSPRIKTTDITEIDGSVLEGGGQILRLSIALSTLLKKPIKINNIRVGRTKSGLRPQHLKGIEMVRDMCGGKLSGAAVNSMEVEFYPGDLKSGAFEADTETAGSVALLIQVALPVALFGPSFTALKLKGGTNAAMAPPVDHTINVLLPTLKKFGADCKCSILRRGYFPKGGGEVEVQINPIVTLNPINITLFGVVNRVWGKSYVAGVLPIKLAHEMADTAEQALKKILPDSVSLKVERIKETAANGNGSGIYIFAETDTGCVLGGSALGSRGVSPNEVGSQAVEELISSIQRESCVDQYIQDQIVILMALAKGKSVVKCGPVTQHTKTAIYIAETLTDAKFTLNETGTDLNFLECEGIGFKNIYRS